MKSKSSTPVVLAAVVGTVFYAAATYYFVDIAGGTKIEADYSNTPNGVTEGPPDFK